MLEITDHAVIARKAVKINSEPGDGHKDGTECIVIAESVKSQLGLLYLVLFNDFKIPVAVADFKIKILSNEKSFKKKLQAYQIKYIQSLPGDIFNSIEEDKTEEIVSKNGKKPSK